MSINFYDHSITTSGTITSPSGNFTTLVVNGTSVSNFNSSVSGLLPTIANSGDNRILTSTGSSVGINAEANLTFDGTNLNLNNQTASTIASFDSSKNLVSLSTTTYPSLTELSYVKGVTSSIQTQIDTKAATSTTITAGSGLAGGGSLAANRTIDIGQGDGITVSADSIAVDSTVIRTTGTQTMSGAKTFSAQTVFASGTAAAPGISIIGDTDTGIAQLIRGGESANTLSLVVGGTERMRIEPGNVKILTPTDDTAEFSISNSIDRDAYIVIDGGSNTGRSAVLEGRANGVQEWYICSTRFHEDGPNNGMALNVAGSNPMTFRTNNTEKMRITSGGNVGIGTSSPNAKLEIQGSSGVYTRLGTTSSSFYVVHNGTTDTFLYTQEASPLRIGTSATERLRITSGGNLEIKSNAGNISTLFTYNENGGELVHYDDTQTAATLLDQCNNQTRLLELINGSDLLLGLGSSNTTGSVRFMRAGFNEAMRIDSAGRVGIGLGGATPATAGSSALQVRGDLDIFGNASDRSITYNVGVGDDGITGWYRGKIAFIPSSATNKISTHIAFFNKDGDNGGSTLTERMRIQTDGNVGIGTSSPSYRLHLEQSGSASTVLSSFLQPSLTTGNFNQIYFGRTGASHDCGTITYSTNATAANSTLSLGLYGTSFTLNVNGNGNVGIGTTSPPELLSVFKDNNAGRTSILIDNLDQRLKMSCYYESGVGQFAEIQSLSNSEAVAYTLVLQRQGGNVGIGPGATNPSAKLLVYGSGEVINGSASGGSGTTNYGVLGQATGAATNNTGFYANAANATNNYGVRIVAPAAGANNWAIYSDATAKSYFAGQIMIGTTTNWGLLSMNHAGATTFAGGFNNTDTGSVGQTTFNFLRNGNSVGSISTTNAATSYNINSDYRLKTSILPINNGLHRLLNLKPIYFQWIVGGDSEGFLAHELAEVIPSAVHGEKDAIDTNGNPIYQGVDLSKLVPLLVAALQETNQELQNIKNRLSALEGE